MDAVKQKNAILNKILVRMGRVPLQQEEVGRHLLKATLGEISRRCWRAGWMDGLEYAVFSNLVNGPGPYGQREITEAEITVLATLVAMTGAWPTWTDDGKDADADGDPIRWVPLDAWIDLYLQSGQAAP